MDSLSTCFGHVKENNQSTPRISKQKRDTCIGDHFTAKRKRASAVVPTAVETKEISVQTISECECDFFDVTDIEMMASENPAPNYYKQLAKFLLPDVQRLRRREVKMKGKLGQVVGKLAIIKSSINESLEIIQLGNNLGGSLDENQVELFAEKIGDSGFESTQNEFALTASDDEEEGGKELEEISSSEESTSTDSMYESLVTSGPTEDGAHGPATPPANNEGAGSSGVYLPSKRLPKWAQPNFASTSTSSSKYVQTNLRCDCHYTTKQLESRVVRQMTVEPEDKHEGDYLEEVLQLRLDKKLCRAEIEWVTGEVESKKKKLKGLIPKSLRLQKRVEDVQEFINVTHNSIMNGDDSSDDGDYSEE